MREALDIRKRRDSIESTERSIEYSSHRADRDRSLLSSFQRRWGTDMRSGNSSEYGRKLGEILRQAADFCVRG